LEAGSSVSSHHGPNGDGLSNEILMRDVLKNAKKSGQNALESMIGATNEEMDAMELNESEKEFYLIVTPGLEDLTAAEVRDWAPDLPQTLSRGGVTLHASLERGLALNAVLKTPSRILVRLADFGCRDFPKLHKKMAGFPWGSWVRDQMPLEFSASSRTSRLKVKKRIESTCLDGRKSYLKKNAPATNPATNPMMTSEAGEPATVFVRFEDDVCTVSLDTSGELLHKRGYRPLSSEAPLRETTAAALVRFLETCGEEMRTDRQERLSVELVDPMMGAGTFLMEAALMRRPVHSRSFAFERLQPWVQSGTEAVRMFGAASAEPYVSFRGYEENPKTLEAARENMKTVQQLLGSQRPVSLHLAAGDFFDSEKLPAHPARWLIANPPYGERIRIKGKLSDFYEQFFQKSEELLQPEKALFLLPEKVRPQRLMRPSGWRILGEKRFLNGGIPVVALVFGRKGVFA
jgi:putative N6-adenine-specific DNA methylase